MTRVLVTGASGLIGRHACRALLRRGFEVHAIARRVPDSDTDITWHACDLLDGHASIRECISTVQPSRLLHLAWFAEHGSFWTSPLNLDWVAATLQLARAFAESGGEVFVGTGSCAEYDWSGPLLSEQHTPCIPRTLYGTSKNAARTVLESFFALRGLQFSWARIFFVYGEDQASGCLVPSIVDALLRGETALCRCGDHERDFLHVEDVGDALAALLASGLRGAINIASGQAVALGELARRIERITGVSGRLQVGHHHSTPDNPRQLHADVTRLARELGWAPAISLDEGLGRVIAQHRHR